MAYLGTKPGNQVVTTQQIADASVTATKLASGAARTNFGAGAVLQVIQTVVTTQFSTTSSPSVATGLAASITPSSATSKILVIVTANLEAVATSGNCYVNPTLKRNSTQIWDGFAQVGNFNSTDIRGLGGIVYLDNPATTSSTTYELYVSAGLATTVRVNGGSGASTITLMEIAA